MVKLRRCPRCRERPPAGTRWEVSCYDNLTEICRECAGTEGILQDYAIRRGCDPDGVLARWCEQTSVAKK